MTAAVGPHADHAGRQPELIHTRQGEIAGIYCDKPAKLIDPQTSIKVAGGQITFVFHMLAMALDDPTMDEDLWVALAAHEIVLGDEWADVE